MLRVEVSRAVEGCREAEVRQHNLRQKTFLSNTIQVHLHICKTKSKTYG